MKRIISLLMVLVIVMAGSTAFAADAEDYSHLTVGSTTHLSGKFVTSYWGNSTSDIDVRKLLFAYSPIIWNNQEGRFEADNMVVSGLVITIDNRTGNKTFDFILQEDLKWSDGTAVTAWDYAFSYLLRYSPVLQELGAALGQQNAVVGSGEYMSGATDVLSGVHVLADNRFTITLDAAYLPFFFEKGLMMEEPYPISTIAPGCKVVEREEGVAIEGNFTAELLAKTLLDAETGYMSHPTIVTGPYTLTSFDGETAEFAVNPYYKGNSTGTTPKIEKLTYTFVRNEQMLQQLADGEVGLLNKVTSAEIIQQGLEQGFRASNYARTGLSFMAFACERTAVSETAVRQAIAYCLNKNELVSNYVGNYGLAANGYYGVGQWMAQMVNGTMTPPNDGNNWGSLTLGNLKTYEPDAAMAKALLEEAGWTLNQNGTAYTGAEGEIRAKKIGDELVTLSLKLVYPEGNTIGGYMDSAFVQPLAKVGIRLEVEAMPWNELLQCYYRKSDRDCDMMYLATNFEVLFDPSANFAFTQDGPAAANYTALQDEALYEAACKMRRTAPGDVYSYVKNWITFQEGLMETLPIIPVYTNVYFDFYTELLQQYDINANTTWSQAIVDAYLSDTSDAATADGIKFIP